MDISLIASALSSIKAAKDLGSAALAQRDAQLLAQQVAQLNDLLLKAQDSLFAHNAQLLELQQERFEATQKVRELTEALQQRGRYSLVEVSPGQFAYRANVTPSPDGIGHPGSAEPVHHICQHCYDVTGKRVVLQEETQWGTVKLCCSACKIELDTGRRVPYSGL